MFMFVILFGLSMDYHVFILSRIREAYDRGLSTDKAIAHGIKSTAGTVTSAAVVMVGVFAVFTILPLVDLKEMGIGLAAAVLIDATIVRAVLLPASMKLLGEKNWYLPKWLEWLPEPRARPLPRARSTRRRRSSPPPRAQHHHPKRSHRPGRCDRIPQTERRTRNDSFQPSREARPARCGRAPRLPRDRAARGVRAGKSHVQRERAGCGAPEGRRRARRRRRSGRDPARPQRRPHRCG